MQFKAMQDSKNALKGSLENLCGLHTTEHIRKHYNNIISMWIPRFKLDVFQCFLFNRHSSCVNKVTCPNSGLYSEVKFYTQQKNINKNTQFPLYTFMPRQVLEAIIGCNKHSHKVLHAIPAAKEHSKGATFFFSSGKHQRTSRKLLSI